MSKKPEQAQGGIERARALYAAGDYKAARALALTVLEDPSASVPAKNEARAIVGSTKLARPSVIAGLVMLAVLAVLYAWVLLRPHVH